jgi:tetratricopeptide (TPR) repeat protein
MPQPAVLHVIGGNDRGKMYELVLPETRIGRGADQDLVLADIAVSRRHITIHAEGGRYRLRDLGSGNGTLVNSSRVDSVLLNDGDQVELGNTLIRFDHAASRVPGMSPYQSGIRAPLPSLGPMSSPTPPPPYVAPAGLPMYSTAPAPSAQPAYPAAQMMPMAETGDAVVRRPPASGTSPLPTVLLSWLATPNQRLIAFGVMGFVALLALIVIVARTAFAKPVVVASDAEASYRQGLKLFAAKDYEGAKISFDDALSSAPEAPEIKRYIAACDVEVRARGSMQSAERAANGRRYAEAVKALDGVDSESLLHDEALKRRKELAPKAAAEDVEEARGLQLEDPDTAKARVLQALALDPGNPEARALATKLRAELPPLPPGPATAAAAPEPAPELPKPVREAPPPRGSASAKRVRASAIRDDDEPMPKGTRPKEMVAPAKLDAAPSSTAALAAYKARDFGNAERLYRMEARNQAGKKMEGTIAFANQVRDLKMAIDKATADEAKNPQAAIKDYEDAIAIDARTGRGMHGAYFRQRMGKLQLPIAQQAFAQGKYDVAFAAVQQAQKAGAGDGGLLRQLDAKAKELTDKGVALQKTNPGQAKGYWRQVIKMVPPSSSNYARAYQLINQGGGGHKDEDED